MKIQGIIAILALLILTGCNGADLEVPQDNIEINQEEEIAKIDTNDNGVADVQVEQNGDNVEVTVDLDDVQDPEIQEALDAAVGHADFCTPGETLDYASEGSSVEALIVGLTTFKGAEFCEAESTTEIESPAGKMVTDTTYYFDNTYKEYWVITSTSGDFLPAPQVNEIHIVDGEVQ